MPANEEGGTLRVEVNHTEHAGFPASLSRDTNDHRILAVGRNLAAEGYDVTIVTKDLPLRLKASIVGLEADEYRNELASDSSWTGLAELDVDRTVIDTLFARARRRGGRGPATCPATPAWSCTPAAQSALGRVRDDKQVHLVRSDRSLFDVRGRSAEQRIAVDLLADDEVGIVSLGGPAGTGKSVLALAAGLEAVLEERTHKRMIVFRPIFPVGGQDLGYLPGSEAEKMMPWGAAVTDALEAIAGQEVIDEVLEPGPARGPAPHPHPGPQPHRQLRHHRRGPEPRAVGAAHRACPGWAPAAGSCSPTTSASGTTCGSGATTASPRSSRRSRGTPCSAT